MHVRAASRSRILSPRLTRGPILRTDAQDRRLHPHLPARLFGRRRETRRQLKDIGKRSRGVPMLHDLDIRFRVMDMFPEYQQVLSLPTPPIELFAQPTEAHRARADRQRLHGRARAQASRSLRRVRGGAADERSRGFVEGNAPGRRRPRRQGHPDSFERPRQAARRARVPAALRSDGRDTTCRSGCTRIAAPTSRTI